MRAVMDVSDDDTAFLNATEAIVLYEGRSGGKERVLATHHEVHLEGDPLRPCVGPGSPLDRRTLDIMIRRAADQVGARKREMIPSNLLYFDEGRMVWHVPAAIRPVWFRTGQRAFDEALSTRPVLWPNLLFVAQPGALRVYALAGPGRPEPGDTVYYAPTYNLYATGGMCAGNVRLPDALSISARRRWEELFFSTEFTHSNYGSTKYHNHPKGHNALWLEMQWRQAFRGYPVRYLVEAKAEAGKRRGRLTVAEVIAG